MEEIKDLIKQEDYEKYKKLLQEFECKAIDIIEDLTYQFKETLAEDIDRKIKGWKDEYERLLKENWKKDDRIAELEQELTELKEKAIVPRFKVNDKLFVIVNNEIEEYYVDEVLLRNKGTLVAYRDNCKKTEITEKNELFVTEQEAQEKLKELKGNE